MVPRDAEIFFAVIGSTGNNFFLPDVEDFQEKIQLSNDVQVSEEERDLDQLVFFS